MNVIIAIPASSCVLASPSQLQPDQKGLKRGTLVPVRLLTPVSSGLRRLLGVSKWLNKEKSQASSLSKLSKPYGSLAMGGCTQGDVQEFQGDSQDIRVLDELDPNRRWLLERRTNGGTTAKPRDRISNSLKSRLVKGKITELPSLNGNWYNGDKPDQNWVNNEDNHDQRLSMYGITNTNSHCQNTPRKMETIEKEPVKRLCSPIDSRNSPSMVGFYQVSIASFIIPSLVLVNGYLSSLREEAEISFSEKKLLVSRKKIEGSSTASMMISDPMDDRIRAELRSASQELIRWSSWRCSWGLQKYLLSWTEKQGLFEPFANHNEELLESQEVNDGISTTPTSSSDQQPQLQAYSPPSYRLSETVSTTLRSFNEDDRDDGDDGDDADDPRKSKWRRLLEGPRNVFFACPYFKHDPGRYQSERSCVGPGWPTIHRVKEHLYRKHMQPKHVCPRCWETFSTQNEMTQHLRADILCQRGQYKPPHTGITQDQERRLRSRKRSRTYQSEVQKWNEIYRILFPDDKEIPLPFYEPSETVPNSNYQCDWVELKNYLRSELPSRIMVAAEHKLDEFEEPMKSRLFDVVKTTVSDVLQEYYPGAPGIPSRTPQQNELTWAGSETPRVGMTPSTASTDQGENMSIFDHPPLLDGLSPPFFNAVSDISWPNNLYNIEEFSSDLG